MKMGPTRTLTLAFAAVGVLNACFSQPVSAARGDPVATVVFSQSCGSGLGVGIAYDGVNLWYSCYGSSPDLYRADPKTGQVTASYNITGGLGALAYDTTRNAIWAGWGGPNTGSVYLIQLDKNGAVQSSAPKFNASVAVVCGLDDGLAFDAQDDSLYISDDCSTVVHHFTSAGTQLGQFSWAGIGCYNSGLAIGGNLLYEGSDGCSHVWVVDKTNPVSKVFDFSTVTSGDPNFRDEGLSCDIFTFANIGKHVMWSKEAYEPMRAHAFEIDFGSCGVGGLPALASAADLARAAVGADYLWGGKGWDWSQQKFVDAKDIISGYSYFDPNTSQIIQGRGVDCSGLVFWSFNKALGAHKYQTQPNPVWYEGADGQFKNNSQPVNEADLRAGDLLFFDFDGDGNMDHVAMYVGADDVVTAPQQGEKVKVSKKSILANPVNGFVGFRRVTTPVVYFQVRTHSPVSLIVSDPDGLTINQNTRIVTEFENLREVRGELYYSQWDINGDGTLSDMIISPHLKLGAYVIRVEPKPAALPTDVYGLEVETAAGILTLAKNAPIEGIPTDGYGMFVTGSGIVPFTPVRVAIKPIGDTSSINLSSKGTVPVAILSTATFDATTIDSGTATLAGAPVARDPRGRLMASFEDVNGDGLLDLVFHFRTADLQLTQTSSKVIFEGETFSGGLIRGVGTIGIVP